MPIIGMTPQHILTDPSGLETIPGRYFSYSLSSMNSPLSFILILGGVLDFVEPVFVPSMGDIKGLGL